MLLIPGANQKLGRRLVDEVLQRVRIDQIAVSGREQGQAADLQACGVAIRRGDDGAGWGAAPSQDLQLLTARPATTAVQAIELVLDGAAT